MRKTISILLLITICLSAFSGCDKAQVYQTVELTSVDLWQYVEVAMITDFVPAESEAPLHCAITGALDQAIYEDVVVTFEVTYYKPGESGPAQKCYDVEITLNAGGNAEFEVLSAGISQIVNGKGKSYEADPQELFWFNRSIRVTSARGKVIIPG